jgi:hypothetical protein
LRVLVNEHFLDSGSVRLLLADQQLKLAGQLSQPLRQGGAGFGPNAAIRDVRKTIAAGFDDAPAGRSEAGIEAEYPQASFSSSSSGTS